MNRLLELQKNFINLRFGTFIHFNSATAQFHASETEDWEYECENGPKPRQYPFDEKFWNPEKLDCRQWAKVAKSAGCRFAALTTKHHEGFALWPTQYSEHCVRNASCTRDVVAEYLEAFREAGIAAGLYFSVLDLTAGIGKRSCTEEQKKLIRGQVTELLTNYGKIPFLIVDGWSAPWGGPPYEVLSFEELDSLVKSLQPDCLLMNIGCSEGIEGTDVVFYENAAGQEVEGSFEGPGVSCNKLTHTWFWRDEDPDAEPVSAEWALEKMNRYFPMNINFMLNISPNPQGQVDENLAEEFAKIGKAFQMPKPLEELPEGWLKR
ncbi:MAG: alpha-L-fucosidase [Lachnospiraceae bacterium]|nr:alpha-L-fucosidase [Lachnospiraceae bacterium]